MIRKLLVISALLASGCATKQYPIAPPISQDEAKLLDCKGLEQEIAKVKSIQQEIDRIGDFDGRTVLGVFGDLGVGNGLAKSEARKKAQARLSQLESLKSVKCGLQTAG
ncbi:MULTISPECIES: hypothetical protein [Serratia]|uniref:Lipoprotein n=2 Tax=Serratia TaxID=613 RepID=A0ABW8QHZ7_9GAMM|nr:MULTISPECIES: hypothetical protein [Serratia]MBH2567297.1 hypothetical protein [Serratia marcescens]MBN5451158.1 hypothetical protein [Serratia marcescens]MCW6024218.1 hypothetical protein [Serratia marcescens]MDP8650683.1 hypothetical protein [Serratia marcescens]MDP8665536.1 hypothetical protein [Serratia marcescens]